MKRLLPFVFIFGALAWIYPYPDTDILVLTASSKYYHASTLEGVEALEKMGGKYGFDVKATSNPAELTEENLKKYRAVVFLNTSGNLLNHDQEVDLQRYIQAGGGFVGIHSAIDTEPDWPWFSEMMGAKYAGHPTVPSNVQNASLYVVSYSHASTRHLPEVWAREDEWLNYTDMAPDVNVLLAVDELSYKGGTNGVNHPVSWYRTFEGGRVFYTGLGHTVESYEDEAVIEHIAGGIQYVLGMRSPLDYKKATAIRAPDESRFNKVVLAEGLDEPTEFEVLDDGRVLFIQRKGEVRLLDPKSNEISEIARINVHTDFEDGLMGLALDPGFETNHWIYLFYSPAGNEAKQHLSRFEFKDSVLDLESEKVMLVVNTQRDECCHTGGSIEFGPDGNLFLSTGDDVNPFASDGFGPMDERPGRAAWDAQGSSANTNDLRGKILRIRPESDGTYSIPEGNLFAAGDSLARAEIYVMGNRNPYRISIDQKTGFLYWGEVGPDANEDSPYRGPRGHDELNQAREAGFFGWPYFVGDNKAYRDYNFDTEEIGDYYDATAPVNDSPNNTGLRMLPSANKAFIWYPYADSPEFPIVKNGGRNAMAGPVFYSDLYEKGRAGFPEYFDGKLFIYDWIRGWILVVTMNEEGDLEKIEPFMPSTSFANPIDMLFDKAGVMYVMEYGNAWFSQNPDARISRIEYNAGNRYPVATLEADKMIGGSPLTVNFTASASFDYDNDPLTYRWRFGGAPVAGEGPEMRHTFVQPGVYQASVQVIDPYGAKSVQRLRIKVGNEAPVVNLALEGNRTFYWDSTALDYHVTVVDEEDGSMQQGQIDRNSVFVQMDYLPQGYDKTLIVQGHKQAVAASGFAGGQRLIEESDCSSCHQLDRSSIGPSFQDVARRYAEDGEAPAKLASKIINGGSGVWGETAMAAHPQITEDEASVMVDFILAQTGDAAPAPASLPISGAFPMDAHLQATQKQGMYFLRASYTDRGANGIGPLTGQSLIVLRHPRVQAETFDTSHNVTIQTGSGNEPSYVKDIHHDSFIGFREIDLTGIRKLTFMVRGTGEATSAGVIEVHLGSPAGPIIGSTEVRMDLSSTPYAFDVEIEPQVNQQNLYFVFKDRQNSSRPLFLLDWVQFGR